MPAKLTVRIARQRRKLTGGQTFSLWALGLLVTLVLRAWFAGRW
jgi:hypothetical protein